MAPALNHVNCVGNRLMNGRSKDDDENVIVPISSEQIGARLRELHIGSALVHQEPAALDRQLQASTIFGRRCALAKQERPVDLLDVDAAVLHRLDAVGDFKNLAGGLFGFGVGPVMLMFSLSRSARANSFAWRRCFDN